MMPVWKDIYNKVKGEADAGTLVTTFDHPHVQQSLSDAAVANKAAGIHAALAAAAILGGAIAVLFSLSRILELSFFPYAVILQVTPIVAIAPLIIIWVQEPFLALLVCAWIVAFFPIVANTTVGLNSADRNLLALFRLYGASQVQILRYLKLPTALPYFLAGLRISGGLALIGAVVAEFVAGTGGTETGLAFRILEAGYRLAIPRLFAALFVRTHECRLFFLDGIEFRLQNRDLRSQRQPFAFRLLLSPFDVLLR